MTLEREYLIPEVVLSTRPPGAKVPVFCPLCSLIIHVLLSLSDPYCDVRSPIFPDGHVLLFFFGFFSNQLLCFLSSYLCSSFVFFVLLLVSLFPPYCNVWSPIFVNCHVLFFFFVFFYHPLFFSLLMYFVFFLVFLSHPYGNIRSLIFSCGHVLFSFFGFFYYPQGGCHCGKKSIFSSSPMIVFLSFPNEASRFLFSC